jgi:hypothetical protein
MKPLDPTGRATYGEWKMKILMQQNEIHNNHSE